MCTTCIVQHTKENFGLVFILSHVTFKYTVAVNFIMFEHVKVIFYGTSKTRNEYLSEPTASCEKKRKFHFNLVKLFPVMKIVMLFVNITSESMGPARNTTLTRYLPHNIQIQI